jgi:hypothetical protein
MVVKETSLRLCLQSTRDCTGEIEDLSIDTDLKYNKIRNMLQLQTAGICLL